MAQSTLVFSVFAADRPQLVNMISDVVSSHQGSWMSSSLSRLCGQFAGLVHVAVDDDKRAALINDLKALSEDGILISERPDTGLVDDNDEITQVELVLEANDRPGIVGEISAVLGQANINIDSLETGCESASMAGYPLFRAHLYLSLPDGVAEDDLDTLLARISDDVMISVLDEA